MNAIAESMVDVLIPGAGAGTNGRSGASQHAGGPAQSSAQPNGQDRAGAVPGNSGPQSNTHSSQNTKGTNPTTGTSNTKDKNVNGDGTNAGTEGAAGSLTVFAEIMEILTAGEVPTEEHQGETTSGDPERGEPVTAAVAESELAALLISGQIKPGEAVHLAEAGGTTQEVPQAQQIAVGQPTASPGEVKQEAIVFRGEPGPPGEVTLQTEHAGESQQPDATVVGKMAPDTAPESIPAQPTNGTAPEQPVPDSAITETLQGESGKTPPGQSVSEAAKELGEIAAQLGKSIQHPPETPAQGPVENPPASVVQIARQIHGPEEPSPQGNGTETSGKPAAILQGIEYRAAETSSPARGEQVEGATNTANASSDRPAIAVTAETPNAQSQSAAPSETPEPSETQRAGPAGSTDTGRDGAVVEQASSIDTTIAPARVRPAPEGPARPQVSETPVSDQISEALRARVVRSGQRVVVLLNPPELGRVRVIFQSEGQELRAVIEAQSARTLGELQREAPSLVTRLAENGVALRRVDFTLSEQAGRDDNGPTGWAEQNGEMWDRGGPPAGGDGEPTEYDAAENAAETPDIAIAQSPRTTIQDDSINVWV